jgi:hypothetical protein
MDRQKLIAALAGTVPMPQPDPRRGLGMIEMGNIDLNARPIVRNPDGSISTVRSMGVNLDGRETLIPTVGPNGIMSNDDAVDHFYKTGEHLGTFDTPENSDAYARFLHETQAKLYRGR